MSEIIYESVERITRRKVYLLEEEGKNPAYLSSKFINQEIIITGVIKGVDYEDAKAGLEALEQECMENDEKTILDMTGKILELRTALKISSAYQPFTITLGIYK